MTGRACTAQRAERATRTGHTARPGRIWAPCIMKQVMLDLGLDDTVALQEIACGEQPQQRMDTFGVGALSDTELIALMLQGGKTTRELIDCASRLIAEAGSIQGIATWQPVDFARHPGIGRVKARQLAALVEVARRMIRPAALEQPVLNRPELIANHMGPFTHGLEIEKFWVLCLNRKSRLKKMVEISSGTATACLVHPREVFRAAIREGAVALACVHNHPSGDPAPSSADQQVTRTLREGARAVDLEFMDHVIVGRMAADPVGKGYFSFREVGMI